MSAPLFGPRRGASAFVLPVRPDNTNGLVGWWTFDGNKPVDVSGNAASSPAMTVGTNAKFQSTQFGNALLAGGGNAAGGLSSVSTTNTSMFPAKLTYMCWVNPSSVASNQLLIGSSTSGYPLLLIVSSGKVEFARPGSNIAVSAAALTAGQWVHVAGSYDTTGLCNVYVNGVLAGSGTSYTTWTGAPFFIGGNSSFPLASGSLIADARVYNRPLQASEIFAIYASALATAQSFPEGDLMTLFSASGASFNQSIALGPASALVFQRMVAKAAPVAPTSTSTFARSIAKLAPVGPSSSITWERGVAKPVPVTPTSTLSFVRGMGKSIALAATSALSFATQKITEGGSNFAQAISVSATSSVTFLKGCVKFVGVAANSLVTLVFPSGAEPVIGDVSVVWSVAATTETEWSAAGQVSATMSQTQEISS